MWNKVIFYNHFGNGDLHESREFVKDIMQIIPAESYYYAHAKFPGILRDIPNLLHTEIDATMDGMSPFFRWGGTLLINTWIGRDSKYVLPGIGCTIGENYRMFNDILYAMRVRFLTKRVIDYIPVIDYSFFDVGRVDDYLANRCGRKKVLICNGDVQSNQASNFDFGPIIERLCKEYPEFDFIITRKIDFSSYNLFSTDSIIMSNTGCDLNEISYLSRGCDVIVGRSSGPFLFCQTKENWMNFRKTFISFTYTPQGSNIIGGLQVMAKKIWSKETATDAVFNKIKEVLG